MCVLETELKMAGSSPLCHLSYVYIFISLGYQCLRIVLLVYREDVHLTLEETAKLFSSVVVLVSFLPAMVKSSHMVTFDIAN